jgi:hypothetical protein
MKAKKKKGTWNQTGKRKASNLLSTRKAEEKIPLSKLKKAVNEEGLKLSWIRFIDEYIANGGNGTQAYMTVYNTKDHPIKESTARVESSRLLRNPNILSELNNKMQASRITPEFIQQQLLSIGTKYRGAKTINAAVKSFELLAKMQGLLIDTKKFGFDQNNPAVFQGFLSPGEKKDFDEVRDKKKRIVE